MLQTGSIITRWHTTVLVKVSWPTACVSSRGHQRWLKHRALLFCCKMDSWFIWGNPWRSPLGWLIGLNVKHTTIISDSLINRSEYTAHKEICVKAAAAECVFTSEPQELSGHNTSMNIFRCYKLQISKTQRSGKETADANQGVEQTLLLGLDWSDARFTFSPMNKVFNDEKKDFIINQALMTFPGDGDLHIRLCTQRSLAKTFLDVSQFIPSPTAWTGPPVHLFIFMELSISHPCGSRGRYSKGQELQLMTCYTWDTDMETGSIFPMSIPI